MGGSANEITLGITRLTQRDFAAANTLEKGASQHSEID